VTPRIHFLTLGCVDLDASVGFYEALGWTCTKHTPHHALFPLQGGLVLSLCPATELADHAGVACVPGAGVALSHNVAASHDVQPLLDRAVAAGGVLTQRAQAAPWGGVHGWFTDPSGVPWEVVWNPRVRVGACPPDPG
jgi:catechol 2,3-dioxygenase-like lactoylglutathione lyase family enzyme